MADLYELYIYDAEGTRQAALQGWEFFEFTQRINAPWNHNLRYQLPSEDKAGEDFVDFLRNDIGVDFILRAIRTDAISGQKNLVYEGFNRTVVDQARSDGSIILNLYGVGLTELLKRRVVIPPSGFESSAKTGRAETVIREYVDEQCISAVDTDRIIPGLSLEANGLTGKTVERTARYTNLYTVVSGVAEDGRVDFGIVGGLDQPVGQFSLHIDWLWGQDKTASNSIGNNPVVFDNRAGHMTIPINSRNRSDEVNVAYIGGPGEGLNRIVLERDGAGITDSPLNRREGFIDARRESSDSALLAVGDVYLIDRQAVDSLTFNVTQVDDVRWLEHWELGDVVTGRYSGRDFTVKITEVSVRLSGGTGTSAIHEYVSAELSPYSFAWELGVVGHSELGESTILG